ncbi:tRNA (guanosine(18)-2'-O)-methyltransferase TrmH [Thermus filiformis]|uniref:tRNA (guanosine(18)-2'-O)-methyltransferase n=1 Tax=Thermus filiformis TaxID=276 RepID=A0A0A2WRD9_THEFI|nr:tRNA (guanosine(18)-2'-O)-methyltransferase TrmH [Thermus filiformis]KGQ22393.2 tRNA (guanine-N2)-dimethyltransferase [Thermus filiformis]
MPERTPERIARIREVLSRRQPDLTVLLENVHKPHNLSAILRTCDAVGVLRAHAVNPTGGVPTFNETSGGSHKWVDLEVHPDIRSAIAHLKGQGFQVLAAHLSEGAVDYREADYTRPTAVLLGAEKWGVSEEAAALSDLHIKIPMMGMVQSLNVSVAAAVILFEAQRQRLRAGMYERPRLDPEAYQRLLEDWLKR